MNNQPSLADRSRPGLSATLRYPRRLYTCQSCGKQADMDVERGIQRWLECDPWDQSDARSPVVLLCEDCGRRLIDPHPRLYRRLDRMEPRPGAIPLCQDCRHHENLACKSPLAKFNGGPGMALRGPAPMPVHIKASRPSQSGFFRLYDGWPKACSGRELHEDPAT